MPGSPIRRALSSEISGARSAVHIFAASVAKVVASSKPAKRAPRSGFSTGWYSPPSGARPVKSASRKLDHLPGLRPAREFHPGLPRNRALGEHDGSFRIDRGDVQVAGEPGLAERGDHGIARRARRFPAWRTGRTRKGRTPRWSSPAPPRRWPRLSPRRSRG